MKLYKFRQVDTYSLSGLSNNSIWFSDLKDFNDPFEGSYVLDNQLSDSKWEEVLKVFTLKPVEEVGAKSQQEMFDSLGITDGGKDKKDLLSKMMERDFNEALIGTIHSSKVVCMSQSSKHHDPLFENLMWSHYTDGLRGFCLVFDKERLLRSFWENDYKLRPSEVEYQDAPLTISVTDFTNSRYFLNQSDNDDLIEKVTRTISMKSKSWSYEQELRLLSLEKHGGHCYEPSVLEQIVIGDKMPKDQQKLVVGTARSANPDIKVKLARLKKNTYQLEIVDY
ncbi:DUF2971 domain-containing protein [Vibrio alginolyticus]|uniref:DUF2971 domain-containing protein n=1 Tax=Vibrio alginolyticus TaxID=663 RepID=UPI003749858A